MQKQKDSLKQTFLTGLLNLTFKKKKLVVQDYTVVSKVMFSD